MRLHTLRLTAFGPFAAAAEVDFDALAGAGLFLFTGPTGAGKTSVLDAVCFALYGQVPGPRQGARSLRSDHAQADIAPEVVLEVTLRGRRLRVTRSPAWDRPKRRGSGSTPEQARVLVQERCGADWVTRSTRLDEAGQLLGGLLGLSMAQFCQVVLLPQGQFADFLRADADRRRALLETLFDTKRFADVEGWLVARRQDGARDLAVVDAELAALRARVAQEAGVDIPEELTPGAEVTWVAGLVEDATQRRRAAEHEDRLARTAAKAAAEEVAESRRRAELRRRAGALRARLADLAAAGPAHEARVSELAAARLVAAVVPLVEEAARAEAELAAAEALVASRRVRLAPVLAATGTGGGGGPGSTLATGSVLALARRTHDQVSALRVAAQQEEEAAELARETDELTRRAVVLAEQAAQAASWLGDAPARRARLAAARDAARDALAALDQAVAERDGRAGRLEAARRRDDLGSLVRAAEDEVRRLTDAHQQAREHEQSLRERRLAGMAAELAAGLADGAGCPVCGSTEHPAPASGTHAVSPAEEEEAGARCAHAEAERRSGEAALAARRAALAEARGHAGGDQDRSELASLLADADQRCAQLATAAAGMGAADDALRAFDAEHERWLRARVSSQADAERAAGQASLLRQRSAALLEEVAAARGTDPTVATKVSRLQRVAADLDALAELVADVDRLRRAHARAATRAAAELTHRRLDSAERVLADRRDQARIAELEAAVGAHESALASVRDQLADPALATALAQPAPDLTVAEPAADEAELAHRAAAAAAAGAAAQVRALRRLARAVDDAVARRDPVAARHRIVDGLARLAEGKSTDNRLRMSLSAYVLAARLEQVAAAASDRLLRMTSGRYRLLHCAQAASGRSRGGLGLRVLDTWTGRERDPATLSGGESFSASLALALGLADVVTAEAGGALLETLFVDEGFGSLDDDTLDDVMGVLDDLRDGGRAVGIVSHVADLRARIPTQLRVEKGRHGSVIVT